MRFLPSFKYFTYSLIPPSYLKLIFFSSDCLLSVKKILIPVFKKASSLSLFSIVLKLKLISLKIFVVGRKVILVPVKNWLLIFSESPITFNSLLTIPFSNSILYTLPFLFIYKFRYSDNALTTETPTPCKPPDTL